MLHYSLYNLGKKSAFCLQYHVSFKTNVFGIMNDFSVYCSIPYTRLFVSLVFLFLSSSFFFFFLLMAKISVERCALFASVIAVCANIDLDDLST